MFSTKVSFSGCCYEKCEGFVHILLTFVVEKAIQRIIQIIHLGYKRHIHDVDGGGGVDSYSNKNQHIWRILWILSQLGQLLNDGQMSE